MRTDDPVTIDAMFLDRHPGWTYRDLMDTPEEIVDALKLLDQKRA